MLPSSLSCGLCLLLSHAEAMALLPVSSNGSLGPALAFHMLPPTHSTPPPLIHPPPLTPPVIQKLCSIQLGNKISHIMPVKGTDYLYCNTGVATF